MIQTNSINILFCKSDMPLSTLIMWGTSQPASHVAIDIEDKGWIVHSDLTGLHKVYRDDFMRSHETIDTFKIVCNPDQAGLIQDKFLSFVDADSGSSYDYAAFAYFTVRAALKKGLGLPLPSHNPFGYDQAFLCTEATYLLNEAFVETVGRTLYPYDVDLGATSPWDLRSLLIKCAGGKNEIDLNNPSPGIPGSVFTSQDGGAGTSAKS